MFTVGSVSQISETKTKDAACKVRQGNRAT